MSKRATLRPRSRTPKVPLRFRALGGVDPRSLPPGTPYPCNDPAVGASVRGKQFAGRIMGCATPPPGKRGRHFVVGGLESRSAIASAKRASERTREALRARYEGPDFDARPKRRAPKGGAPVATPRPTMVVRRTPEMDGPAWSPPKRPWQMTFEEFTNAHRAEIHGRANQRLAASASKVKVHYKYNAPSSAGPFTGSMDVAASADVKKGKVFAAPFGAATVTSVRRLPIVSDPGQAIMEELAVAQEMYREAVRNAVRSGKNVPQRVLAEARHRLPEVGGARWPTPKRTPEISGPAWSPTPPKKARAVDEAALTEAILAHMDARGIPRSPKGAAHIVSALLDHQYPEEGALDTHNKNYRAIFSFFAGAKLPTTNKGTREFIEKGEFSLIPASLWGGSKAEVDKRDAAVLGEAYRLLAKSFLSVARQPFGPGEMPIPGQRVSISDAVATPSFVPKGATQMVKVYVVRLHEAPGVYAFIVREKDPQHTHGLQGGAMDKIVGVGAWKKMLARAVEK